MQIITHEHTLDVLYPTLNSMLAFMTMQLLPLLVSSRVYCVTGGITGVGVTCGVFVEDGATVLLDECVGEGVGASVLLEEFVGVGVGATVLLEEFVGVGVGPTVFVEEELEEAVVEVGTVVELEDVTDTVTMEWGIVVLAKQTTKEGRNNVNKDIFIPGRRHFDCTNRADANLVRGRMW